MLNHKCLQKPWLFYQTSQSKYKQDKCPAKREKMFIIHRFGKQDYYYYYFLANNDNKQGDHRTINRISRISAFALRTGLPQHPPLPLLSVFQHFLSQPHCSTYVLIYLLNELSTSLPKIRKKKKKRKRQDATCFIYQKDELSNKSGAARPEAKENKKKRGEKIQEQKKEQIKEKKGEK